MTLIYRFAGLSRILTTLFLIGIAAFVSLPEARADLIVSTQSVTVSAGSSGNGLDVELSNTGPSAVTIGAFSFGVTTANSGISFTGANVSTLTPYIFAGDSLFGPDITISSGQALMASDLFDISFNGASIASGSTVGLGHLLFDVAPGAGSGVFPATLVAFPTTSLADDQGIDVPIQTFSSGNITIGAAAAPEPSSWSALAFGIALVLIYESRRRSYSKSY